MIDLIQAPGYNKIKSIRSLEVCGTTYTNVCANWIHREQFLSTDEMIYLSRGELYLKVNKTRYVLHPNSFFFIHRFSSVAGYRNSETPCEFYTVSYNGILSPEMELHEITLKGSLIYTDEILKRLYNIQKNGAVDSNERNILFLSLIYEAERFLLSKNDPIPLMEQTLQFIHNNIDKPITVDSVCDYLGYNRDYISRQFLQCYGITIKKYIDRRKISAAKHLLISSKMSLEQIGAALGFDNAQQFYKFFSYHEKISPSQFRKINA